MWNIIFMRISLLFSIILNIDAYNYCSISRSHTLCRYNGPSRSCGRVVRQGVRDRAEKDQILSLHNQMRSQVAQGRERRGRGGPQPPAANMYQLVWDEELANIAQRWSEQCRFAHDANRNVQRFTVGQNLYLGWETGRSISESNFDWNKAITAFYDEVRLFNTRSVSRLAFSPSTGHYTQLVWAKTHKIGCGKTIYYKTDGSLNKNLVCNYGPGGNVNGGQMYQIGSACSACPNGCAGNGLCRVPGGGRYFRSLYTDISPLNPESSEHNLEVQEPDPFAISHKGSLSGEESLENQRAPSSESAESVGASTKFRSPYRNLAHLRSGRINPLRNMFSMRNMPFELEYP